MQITLNNYTQGESEEKINKNIFKSKNILEVILSEKDCNYQLLERSEKENYVIKKSLELSSHIDEHYDKYNYNKRKFNKNLISNSLQSKNNLSSILFYNDYFNINIVICNKIHDLIMDRAIVVEEVAKEKKKQNKDNIVIYRPSREHEILVRLLNKHVGSFPEKILISLYFEFYVKSKKIIKLKILY